MQWDIGLTGVAVLLVMSLAVGVLTQVVFWGRASHWQWLATTAVMLALGVLISEVWFGWATEEELQPNIDGLSFDEVLIGFALAVGVALLGRYLVWRRSHRLGAA